MISLHMLSIPFLNEIPAASRMWPMLSKAFLASASTPPGTNDPVCVSSPNWPDTYRVLST